MHTAPNHLEQVLAQASQAAPTLAALPPQQRADLLLNLAEMLEQERATLIDIAERETGLTPARLTGEVARTALQLRLFAEATLNGTHHDVRIDEADTDFVLGFRPDLRRTHIPVGPVLNFSASNFPFAFSVLGGDSAAILSAGCPLIVKAHSGHPELSDATAAYAQAVVARMGLPIGTIQLIHGQENGVIALQDERVRAAAFTGSTHGGRVLADIAAARPAPIPFFGELGSINPVFVSTAAIREASMTLASEYLSSVAGSAGQLCTKPGLVFAHETGITELVTAITSVHDAPHAPLSEHRLLSPRIATAYNDAVTAATAVPGVTPIVSGTLRFDQAGQGWATPTILLAPLQVFREHRETLAQEVFGPFSVLIAVEESTPFAPLVSEFIEGSLTGTVHLSTLEGQGKTEAAVEIAALVDALATHAGRVLFNGWPTGVAVTPAQQHGGPWPATTNDSSTSVGTAAMSRFLRPVAYQNAPEAFLPAALRDDNPLQVPQTRSAAGESLSWGK